jgi:hypothetical protein
MAFNLLILPNYIMDLLNKLGKNINKYYTKAVREYEDVV